MASLTGTLPPNHPPISANADRSRCPAFNPALLPAGHPKPGDANWDADWRKCPALNGALQAAAAVPGPFTMPLASGSVATSTAVRAQSPTFGYAGYNALGGTPTAYNLVAPPESQQFVSTGAPAPAIPVFTPKVQYAGAPPGALHGPPKTIVLPKFDSYFAGWETAGFPTYESLFKPSVGITEFSSLSQAFGCSQPAFVQDQFNCAAYSPFVATAKYSTAGHFAFNLPPHNVAQGATLHF